MTDRELDHAMDACRPSSDDLQLPELETLAKALAADAELRTVFQQRQQQDARLAEALARVRLAPERRDRLLRIAQSVDAVNNPSGPVQRREAAYATRQRRLLVAGLSLAAMTVALLGLVTWNWLDPWRTVSPQRLAHWAVRDWTPNPTAWRVMGELPVPRQLATTRFLRLRPARWQSLTTHLDPETLVFDLPGHTQPARLYVLRAHRRVRRLPTSPPQQPQTAYEGWLFAAWQEGTRVYLIGAAGSTQHYRDVIQPPGHSLANGTADDGKLVQ